MAPRKPDAEKEQAVEAAAVEASEEQAAEAGAPDFSGTVGIQDGAAASTAGPTGNGLTDEQEDAIREAITGPGWEPSK